MEKNGSELLKAVVAFSPLLEATKPVDIIYRSDNENYMKVNPKITVGLREWCDLDSRDDNHDMSAFAMMATRDKPKTVAVEGVW